MKVIALAPFICPLDGEVLEAAGGGVRCAAGHVFDRAREGYFNLLPVQHKASRHPGDDQAMVSARRRILDDGLFQPLAAALFDALLAAARQRESARPLRIVDAGCGEGYYLAELRARALASEHQCLLALAGYDISKWAVRAAARRCRDIAWAVASNRQPPFSAASVDLLLSLFGFPHWPAFETVLAAGGQVWTVDGDSEHLRQLREIIYPSLDADEASTGNAPHTHGWQLLREQRLAYRVELGSAEQIQALITMTPHAHRMSAAGRAALVALSCIEVTMSVVMRAWQPPTRPLSSPLPPGEG